MKRKHHGVPGSIYQNGKRWWWNVRLPGEAKAKARPLKPANAQLATEDLGMAVQTAKEMFAAALLKQRQAGERVKVLKADRTIEGLYQQYMDFAKTYYLMPDGTPSRQVVSIELGCRQLRAMFSKTLADEFGPKELTAVRKAMIADDLSRGVINQRATTVAP